MGKGWMAKRWKMGSALLAGLGMAVCLAGCSQADAVQAAKTIHSYLPAVMGLVKNAEAIAGAIDPAEASAVQGLSARIQTELQELETVSGAYAAAPSADGWARMGAVVDALVSDADEGLLAALAIKNPASQARAKIALSAVDAAMHVVDGYLMSARTPEEAKAVAAHRALNNGASTAGTVKLHSVVRYWSPEDWRRVEQAYGGRGEELAVAEMRLGF